MDESGGNSEQSGAGDVDNTVHAGLQTAAKAALGIRLYILPRNLSPFCQGLESLSEAEF